MQLPPESTPRTEVVRPAPVPARAVRGRLQSTLAIARPRQWLKNALVAAAPAAAGALGGDDVPGRVAFTVAAFCMLASGIYAINDVCDVAEDRVHPRKRFRPVAAGEISPRVAVAAGVGSILAGLVLCAEIGPLVLLIGAGYVAITISYTFACRRVVVVDLLAIASGFVLRAVAGGAAAGIWLSPWFLVVVSSCAILVAAGKRYAELQRVAGFEHPVRRVLAGYSEWGLKTILWAAAGVATVAYLIWAFDLPAVHGVPWRPLSAVPFVASLGAYGRVVRSGRGEAPEDVFLDDRWLLFAALAWVVLFVVGVDATL